MSISPHILSNCCNVPVLGTVKDECGICSNCKQPCTIDVIDDGERSFTIRMAAIKRRTIEEVSRYIEVTGFSRVKEKITVEFNDRSGLGSYCIINNNDFLKWASANSYITLLPETEYVAGNNWDKQPHEINRRLNVTERVRFYSAVDKAMLEHYLNDKIQLHYATAS